MSATFDTFVFDLDGTLLDTLPDLVVLTNAALAEHGLPERSTEEIHSYVGNGARALIYQAVPQGTPDDVADAVMRRWKELYPTLGSQLTRPYPHIPETIAALRQRGARVAVLSNKFDQGVQDIVTQCLPGLFDVMHGEGPDIPRKPDPTGLLRTIAELGSTPDRTAYVGDSDGDMAVARNAGTFALGVSWGYHTAERLWQAQADAVIDDARDLLQFARPSAMPRD